ncbi:solute carrier family 45 member 3-like isoform X1 [Mytilus trossulus]|uniref:solute carrier family 45 member 3-like isoform X1 n=2 Tax=Mytilus trossulus TaxID=6551 RepID=UPI003007B887
MDIEFMDSSDLLKSIDNENVLSGLQKTIDIENIHNHGNLERCSHSASNIQSVASTNMDDNSCESKELIPNIEVTQHLQSIMPPEGTTGTPEPKRSLTLMQMILLNAIVCGVEVCACAGFTYIPPMLLKAGYTEENMSIILGMGPFLGLIVVPIIGKESDRCKSRFGRRRPFIAGLSLVLLFSLLFIPYGDVLFIKLLGDTSFSKTMCLVGLTVGVILLDFTSQACLTPCEALLSDASQGTQQHEQIFTIYSQMVSCGGFLGYLVTAIDWNSMSIGHFFGSQEKTVFSVLTVLFLLLFTTTIIVAKEEPLSERVSSHLDLQQLEADIPEFKVPGSTLESGYESSINSDEENYYPGQLVRRQKRVKSFSKSSKKTRNYFTLLLNLCLYPLIFVLKRIKVLTVLQTLCKAVGGIIYEKLPETVKNLINIPYVLKVLALANFCSWTALMGFNLFFTDFVGQAIYGGNPNAPENSILRNHYDEGVRMASWGLLFHCITSAIYAFLVERLVNKFGTRWTYFFGMFSFSIAMFCMVTWRNIYIVNLMAAFTGFAYATLTTIPFILVTTYHTDKQVFFFDVNSSGPSRGVGGDMGTLDTAYFLSQVVLSGLMGYIVHMTGTVLSYMVTAGAMGILSCICVQRIISNKHDLHHVLPKPRENMRILNI